MLQLKQMGFFTQNSTQNHYLCGNKTGNIITISHLNTYAGLVLKIALPFKKTKTREF